MDQFTTPPHCKLNYDQVATIKGLSRFHIPVTEIVQHFPEVSYQAVYNIVSGRTWKTVQPASLYVTDGKGTCIEPNAAA